MESELKNLNQQLHYTGQYLANKSVYAQFRKSKNKQKFRQEHSAELTFYEKAVTSLKEKNGTQPLPNDEATERTEGKTSNSKRYSPETNTTITGITRKNYILYVVTWI